MDNIARKGGKLPNPMKGHHESVAFEASEYLERHGIRDLMESLVAALAFVKPEDPFGFVEDCIKKIRTQTALGTSSFSERLKWDAFLPANDGSRGNSQIGIVRRTGSKIIPPIFTLKHMRSENPALGVMQKLDTLPSISTISTNAKRKSKAMKNIVFVLGPSGSGKGTQCQKLAQKYNFMYLCKLDLLNKEQSRGTSLGLEIASLMKNEQVIPTVSVWS